MMKFECIHCGNCCRHSGNLRFTREDWIKLLAYLGKDEEQMRQEYTVESIDDTLFFIWVDDVCPFLTDDNQCGIESVKPFYCKTYIPFLDDKNNPVHKYCKGIGHGKEYTEEDIAAIDRNMREQFIIRRK